MIIPTLLWLLPALAGLLVRRIADARPAGHSPVE